MDKDPARQYPSVAALAADIRRHLTLQPIDARPITTLVQLSKFARRNRPLVAGAAAMLLTLIADFQEPRLTDIDLGALGLRMCSALFDAHRAMSDDPAARAEEPARSPPAAAPWDPGTSTPTPACTAWACCCTNGAASSTPDPSLKRTSPPLVSRSARTTPIR